MRRNKDKKTPKKITAGWLRSIGVKEVLIAGIIFAVGTLNIKNWDKLGPDIYKNRQAFPDSGVVRLVVDGDTFELQSGVRVRMIGINAPDRGDRGYEEAKVKTTQLIEDKRVYLEYDRYQDDKNGRRLAWVWIGCEDTPKFKASDYMHLTYNKSREGLVDNPEGCKKGILVQEELVRLGFARVEMYKERGELKYEKKLESD